MNLFMQRQPAGVPARAGTTTFKRSLLAATVLAAPTAPTTEEKIEILTQEVERLKTEVEKQKSQQPAARDGGQSVAPHGSASESRVLPHGAGSAGATRCRRAPPATSTRKKLLVRSRRQVGAARR